ncbi:TetR family transcriptional regulator [Microbacterium sp. BF1]|uniref:TetR family transcriptional regulator n=1 Tax=Microbacterium sp. BF1 TaxID=2821146 RepID=UPI00211A478F|nr:TetR family transcriptional regulator [Microbacterium sp. BF1]
MARASAADAAETARRILETAASHFAAQGYGAASVDEIARASAVTRGAVYHHYTSKPLLFAAVAAEQQRIVADAIVTATADTSARVLSAAVVAILLPRWRPVQAFSMRFSRDSSVACHAATP